jgi:hypothetical protein
MLNVWTHLESFLIRGIIVVLGTAGYSSFYVGQYLLSEVYFVCIKYVSGNKSVINSIFVTK